MPVAIITVGVSASGKSTFAKEYKEKSLRTVEVNRDAIRKHLVETDGKEWCWENWNWKREGEVTAIATKELELAITEGFDIIVSDTNLKKEFRDNMIQMFKDHGYKVEIKEFPITWEEAVKRDNARANGVGQTVLAKQFAQWQEYKGTRRQYVADQSKPKAILVDVDGTLAHNVGRRGPFEWDKVQLDEIDEQVKEIVNSWYNGDLPRFVIVLSGRDEVCRELTAKHLDENGVLFNRLLMRKKGDMRKDTIVKEELFWAYIADFYNVQFVIDDRPSVCRMWREIGLKVFQVGDPHIEF